MINALKKLLIKNSDVAVNGYLLGKLKSGKDLVQTLEEAKKHTIVTYDEWPESEVALIKMSARRVNKFLDVKEPVLMVNVGIVDEHDIFRNSLSRNNVSKVETFKVNPTLDGASPGLIKSLAAATKEIMVALNKGHCVVITPANPQNGEENEALIRDFKELSKEVLESAMNGDLRNAKLKREPVNAKLPATSASVHFELIGAGRYLASVPVYVFPQARSVSATVTYYEKLADSQNLSPATLANIFTFLKVDAVIDGEAPVEVRSEPFVLSYVAPADLAKKIAA